MTITLSEDGITIDLKDIEWVNEYSESPVVQAVEWSLSGASIIDCAVKQSGLSIVLAGSESRAWLSTADADQIRTWRDIPAKQMNLLLRGVVRRVVFDHRATAFEARPLFDVSDAPADWPHAISLRFLTV